jgi:hypothetical protein
MSPNIRTQVATFESISRYEIKEKYLPEDRAGLYRNEEDAIKFANGEIISDQDPLVFNEKSEVEMRENLVQTVEEFNKFKQERMQAG